jgi:hypothetical protein
MNANIIAPEKANERERLINEQLLTAFLDNYSAFKRKEMLMKDELKYKLLCSPGPSQYRAFFYLFNFFKEEERIVKAQENKDYLYMYDAAFMDNQAEPAMLHFVKNLTTGAYDARGKKIILAFGSFWGHHHPTRGKMISFLNELDNKGADVRIYTQAKEDECYISDINQSIKIKSHFALQKRISIHYVRVDRDYIFLEFPHTETSEFRLNWFLQLDGINFKWWKTKGGLSRYFDTLIRRAL